MNKRVRENSDRRIIVPIPFRFYLEPTATIAYTILNGLKAEDVSENASPAREPSEQVTQQDSTDEGVKQINKL